MMSMKKRKSVPKNTKPLTLIVTLLFLLLIASISLGFVLSMNNQDEVVLSISVLAFLQGFAYGGA